MHSPEMLNKFSEWRARAAAGTLSTAEMKEAIAALRESRRTAAETSTKTTRRTAKSPARSAEDLLNELGGLGG